MPEYKEPRRVALAGRVESVIATDRDKLLRPDLANLSFKDAADNIDRIRRLILRLRGCDLDLLSENNFQRCNRFVSDADDLFRKIQNFSPSNATSAPAAERNQIIERCNQLFNESNDILVIPFAVASPTIQETDRDVRLILESAKSNAAQVLDEVKSQTEKARQEIEVTLQSVRAATGAIGIEKQAEVFKNAAREHAEGRKNWLNVTVVLAVATVLGLLMNWVLGYRLGPPSSSIALIQLAVAKVLVFSFLLSAVVWAGKVYRSHQHNYVLNKHRQNALEVFQLFARAAEHDPETKSMVLLQATKSIFNIQPTGFLSGDKDSDGSAPQVLEIIRSLSSASKS
jgi:ElaB/YqjD/DUF883 family membrane-anchored ribosome-binding protein